MSTATGGDGVGGVRGRLRSILRGTEDTRVRATYRVLFAMPVFWILAGGVLAGNLRAVVDVLPSGDARFAGLTASLLHGTFVLAILVVWARYLDRRPLSEYGVSASRGWGTRAVLGLCALGLSYGLWFGLFSVLGWATVGAGTAGSGGPAVLDAVVLLAALGVHVALQQLVFFRIVLGNAAEGLHSRGVTARRATLAGVLVAIPFFVAIHELSGPLRVLDLLLAGLVYGLLYVHTGDLSYGIGVHLGAFVAPSFLFVSPSEAADGLSLFQVTTSLPESVGLLGSYGFPKVIVAYCLVLGYLVWRHGEVPVAADLPRPTGE